MGSWSESSPVLGAGRSSGRIFDRPVVTWAKMLQKIHKPQLFRLIFEFFIKLKVNLKKFSFQFFIKNAGKNPKNIVNQRTSFDQKKSSPVQVRYRYRYLLKVNRYGTVIGLNSSTVGI